MSVCVECLIRNDFYDIDNIEAVKAELNRASNILNDYFNLEGDDKFRPYVLDGEDYQVCSETHPMSIIVLKKGYWHISSAYKYHQLFLKPLFVRNGFYEIAEAFGKNEAWYCDEYRLWNSGDKDWDYETQTFEEWLQYINSTYGPIKDYPINEILSNNGNTSPIAPVYYDDFKRIEI